MVAHRRFGETTVGRALTLRDVPRILMMFHAVSLALMFFRSPDFASAQLFIEGLMGAGEHSGWPVLQVFVVLACVGLHVFERWGRENSVRVLALAARSWPGAVAEGFALGLIVTMSIAVGGSGGEFIYFQF